MAYLQPRSILVGQRRTSIRLEEVFWNELTKIAEESGRSIAEILTEIAASRPENLTSAIRVFVLTRLRNRVATRDGNGRQGRPRSRPQLL